MASGDSGFASMDPISRKRLNRMWIVGRLQAGLWDIDVDGTLTVTPVPVDGDDILTSETTHYTVPSSDVTVAIIRRITLTNNHSAALQASVHVIASAGSRTVANRIFSDTIDAGETVVIDTPYFAGASATLRSISSAATADQLSLRAEVLLLRTNPSGLTLRVIEGAALTASAATYATAGTVTQAILWSLTICNTDSAARTVTVYLIESGGSAAGTKTIFNDTVQAGETVVLDGPFYLETGDFIQALASVTSVVSIRPTLLETN